MRNASPKVVAKPKNFWGTLSRLLKYMSKKRWILLLTVILSAVATVLQVVTPRILGTATTTIYEGVKQ